MNSYELVSNAEAGICMDARVSSWTLYSRSIIIEWSISYGHYITIIYIIVIITLSLYAPCLVLYYYIICYVYGHYIKRYYGHYGHYFTILYYYYIRYICHVSPILLLYYYITIFIAIYYYYCMILLYLYYIITILCIILKFFWSPFPSFHPVGLERTDAPIV